MTGKAFQKALPVSKAPNAHQHLTSAMKRKAAGAFASLSAAPAPLVKRQRSAPERRTEPNSYVELQQRCMRHGIRANQKAAVLRPLLRAAEFSSSPSTAAAPLPAAPPSPPREFVCSLTLDLMNDPVSDRNGNTFEHAAIVEALRHNAVSPITRDPMSCEDLHPNRALRDSIERWRIAHNLGPIPAAAKPMPPAARAPRAALAPQHPAHLQRMREYGAAQREARAATTVAARRKAQQTARRAAAARGERRDAAEWRCTVNRELRGAGAVAASIAGLQWQATLPDTVVAVVLIAVCIAVGVAGAWDNATVDRAKGHPRVATVAAATLLWTHFVLALLLPPRSVHFLVLLPLIALYALIERTLVRWEKPRGTVLKATLSLLVTSELVWRLAQADFAPNPTLASQLPWFVALTEPALKGLALAILLVKNALACGVVAAAWTLRPLLDVLVDIKPSDEVGINHVLANAPSKHASKPAFVAAALFFIADYIAWLAPIRALCYLLALTAACCEARRAIRESFDLYPAVLSIGLAVAGRYICATLLILAIRLQFVLQAAMSIACCGALVYGVGWLNGCCAGTTGRRKRSAATTTDRSALYVGLKRFRLETARAMQKPAFVVFDNKVLDALVTNPPQSTRELRGMYGWGDYKVAKYGEGVVALCRAK